MAVLTNSASASASEIFAAALKDYGHPVVGDTKYRGPASPAGLCLHAWRLAFIHLRTGKKLFFETDLPTFAGGSRSSTPSREAAR